MEPILISLNSFEDNRGFFYESYKDTLLKTHNINNNILYFNLISQYYKVMKSFLSLLSERREMRVSKKCHPGFGCGIEPRSSHTEGVCATNAPLHIHLN